MNSSKTFQVLCNYTFHFVLILSFFEGTIYSANRSAGDSLITHLKLSTKTFPGKISEQKPASNFYRTDSIFSFRSKKGYFPSLIHNTGEQAAAPFHFTAKQWIYTGVAAGITTALIFADEDIDEWARVDMPVGISRLTEHEHWVSDVFAGALLGYLSGKEVVNHYNKTHQNSSSSQPEQKKRTEISFTQYGNQFGVTIVW